MQNCAQRILGPIMLMLEASVGEQIYFGYTSNGHVAKDFFGVGTNVNIWFRRQGTIARVSDLDDSELVGSPPFPMASAEKK